MENASMLALNTYNNRLARTALVQGVANRTNVQAGLAYYAGYNAEAGRVLIGNNSSRAIGSNFISTAVAQSVSEGAIAL